jgi:hypothetical protein
MSSLGNIRRVLVAATAGGVAAYSINNPVQTKQFISTSISVFPTQIQHYLQHLLLKNIFRIYSATVTEPQDALDVLIHSTQIDHVPSLAGLVLSGDLLSWVWRPDSRDGLIAALVLLKTREPEIFNLFIRQVKDLQITGNFESSDLSDLFKDVLAREGSCWDELQVLEKVGLVEANFGARKKWVDRVLWSTLLLFFLVV